MRREDKFVMSHRQYAVNLSTLCRTGIDYPDMTARWYSVDAVWYRRKNNTTTAVAGILKTLRDEPPADAETFLRGYEDGRYGGRAEVSWDGDRLWTDLPHHLAVETLELVLMPMIAADAPIIPTGYDGWWTFQKGPAD